MDTVARKDLRVLLLDSDKNVLNKRGELKRPNIIVAGVVAKNGSMEFFDPTFLVHFKDLVTEEKSFSNFIKVYPGKLASIYEIPMLSALMDSVKSSSDDAEVVLTQLGKLGFKLDLKPSYRVSKFRK